MTVEHQINQAATFGAIYLPLKVEKWSLEYDG